MLPDALKAKHKIDSTNVIPILRILTLFSGDPADNPFHRFEVFRFRYPNRHPHVLAGGLAKGAVPEAKAFNGEGFVRVESGAAGGVYVYPQKTHPDINKQYLAPA